MTTFTHWRFHIDQQNIGWLELDVAGSSVNVLQREVMREWAEIMDNLIETKGLSGLCLLSGKKRGFVYGADIAEFDDLKTKADVYESIELADTILSGIEALDCPTVITVSPTLPAAVEFAVNSSGPLPSAIRPNRPKSVTQLLRLAIPPFKVLQW